MPTTETWEGWREEDIIAVGVARSLRPGPWIARRRSGRRRSSRRCGAGCEPNERCRRASPDGCAGAGGTGGGIGPSCAGASPLDVWTTDFAPEDIRGVFAVAPNDAWMTTSQHVRHWDGATWTNVPLDFDTSSLLGPVWASGADDVWVTGSRLMRWNGTVWIDMAIPAAYAFPTVVGRGPNDVWAWTTQQSGPQIAHWDGSSWSDRSPLHDPLTTFIGIQVLWLASADDVWLAGYGPSGALLEHWNGASWELSPVTTGITSFTGMWGSSPTDIWLLGNRGMMHYNGINWTLRNLPSGGRAASGAVAPATCGPPCSPFTRAEWRISTGRSGRLSR